MLYRMSDTILYFSSCVSCWWKLEHKKWFFGDFFFNIYMNLQVCNERWKSEHKGWIFFDMEEPYNGLVLRIQVLFFFFLFLFASRCSSTSFLSPTFSINTHTHTHTHTGAPWPLFHRRHFCQLPNGLPRRKDGEIRQRLMEDRRTLLAPLVLFLNLIFNLFVKVRNIRQKFIFF